MDQNGLQHTKQTIFINPKNVCAIWPITDDASEILFSNGMIYRFDTPCTSLLVHLGMQ